MPPAGPDLEAQYFVVAPVMRKTNASWVLLGEWPKLVPVSPQRFVAILATNSDLEVTVVGDAHEAVVILAAFASDPVRELGFASDSAWETLPVTCQFGPHGGRLIARWSLGAAHRVVSVCD